MSAPSLRAAEASWLDEVSPDLLQTQCAAEFLNDSLPAADSIDSLRVAELEADLKAQREYSGRSLGQAWELIGRLRGEVEVERSARQAAESAASSVSAAVTAALQTLQKENSALRSSISWRITAPLRAAGEIVLRLMRRG